MHTKYSDVLPEGSFTPPPYIVVEVLCTCVGVLVRVLAAVDGPDLRMVVPRSQLLRWAISTKRTQTNVSYPSGKTTEHKYRRGGKTQVVRTACSDRQERDEVAERRMRNT